MVNGRTLTGLFAVGPAKRERKTKMPKLSTIRNPVRYECGVPKVSQPLAEFMASCKAIRTTRYSINNVGVKDGVMAVTDGRRLLVVTPTDTFEPPIVDGLYHLTGEGFLLKTDDDRTFPKWQDVIPEAADKLSDVVISEESGLGIAKAIRTILEETKGLWNIKWLLDALTGLRSCGCSGVTISVPGGNNPILIKAETIGVRFQYVQMPFSNGI